jgi:hypothetical protein
MIAAEVLEARRLLSATYTYEDGVLVVTGTDGDDDIEVHVSNLASGSTTSLRLEGQYVLVAGPTDLPAVARRVIVRGGGGNDTIRVGQTFIDSPVTVLGGPGDDRVTLGGTVVGYPARVGGGVATIRSFSTAGRRSNPPGPSPSRSAAAAATTGSSSFPPAPPRSPAGRAVTR